MANPEHVAKLKEGVEVWNRWSKENPGVLTELSRADLRGANLNGADLREADLRAAKLNGADLIEANLWQADLHGADIREAYLNEASLAEADLRRANLHGADLSFANLWQADLHGADLSGADLSFANLWLANLSEANLSEADLQGADLYGVVLSRADLSGANLYSTIFGNVDLRTVKGLKEAEHVGPSTVGIDTVVKSKGEIPEKFLRGCGVPDTFITYLGSLVAKAIEYYSAFISYSSKDEAFAKRLHADLQDNGVRCWFAPEKLKIGDRFWDRIEESIRIYDKLLVILSEQSIASDWVQDEVEACLERERETGETVLFPVRVDEAVMESGARWAGRIRRARHIGNFTSWREQDRYQEGFERLLRDLKAEE